MIESIYVSFLYCLVDSALASLKYSLTACSSYSITIMSLQGASATAIRPCAPAREDIESITESGLTPAPGLESLCADPYELAKRYKVSGGQSTNSRLF